METNAEKTSLNIFLTAGTTGLGRATTKALTSAGHKVYAHANEGSKQAALIRENGGFPVYADLSRDSEVASVIRMAKADVVVHLASQKGNQVPFGVTDYTPEALLAETAAIVSAAQSAGVKFLVHTSFAWIYGDTHGTLVDEKAKLGASDHPLVQAAKKAEKSVTTSGIPYAILRAGYVYGAQSSLMVELSTLLKGGQTVSGTGSNNANWIHTDDFAQAVRLTVEQQPSGQVFNVVDDAPTTTDEFLEDFAGAIGVPAGKSNGFLSKLMPSRSATPDLSTSTKASNAKAKESLGWKLKYANHNAGIDQVLLTWRADMAVKT